MIYGSFGKRKRLLHMFRICSSENTPDRDRKSSFFDQSDYWLHTDLNSDSLKDIYLPVSTVWMFPAPRMQSPFHCSSIESIEDTETKNR